MKLDRPQPLKLYHPELDRTTETDDERKAQILRRSGWRDVRESEEASTSSFGATEREALVSGNRESEGNEEES